MLIRLFLIPLFIVTFISCSAFSQPDELKRGSFLYTSSTVDIMGTDGAVIFSDIIDINENFSWEIHVPENYNPDFPPGILIYVSPQNSIKIPRGWLEIIEDNNLIWIAALDSGNKIEVPERFIKALLAPFLLQSNYIINTNRIYITGFSGGGRVASIVATQYPHLIKGAIYNCGVNFWENLDEERTRLVLNNRFVFVTGSDDFNLQDTKNVFRKYKKAGAQNIDLMIINGMGHENPHRNRLDQAIKFLDEK